MMVKLAKPSATLIALAMVPEMAVPSCRVAFVVPLGRLRLAPVPRAAESPRTTVPPRRSVSPAYVLTPLRMTVPPLVEPRASLPLVEPVPVLEAIMALTVKVVPVAGASVPVPLTFSVRPRLAARVISAVVRRIPPLKVRLSATKFAGAVPSAVTSLTMTAPPLKPSLPV